MPSNVFLQTQNLQNLVSWDIAAGATSYSIQRSTDGVNFSTLDTSSVNNYLDIAIVSGTLYYYQVASVNSSGISSYATPGNGNAVALAPAPNAEMSLLSLRFACQQKADKVNSNFVTTPEWNTFIDLALYELYDLLITTYEDYNVATPIQWLSDGTTFLYPLPNGLISYTNRITLAPITAVPFYKLLGVDLGLNSSNNGYVTVNNFNFVDRNTFVYPNTASTIYGVFNLQYKLVGSNIMFIPTPSAGQTLSMWYIPRLNPLLRDTDVTTIGISGWLQYVICRAAKYALDKEESDTSKLDSELLFLKKRIEESSATRDAGMPGRISNVRGNGSYWQYGSGSGGSTAGF